MSKSLARINEFADALRDVATELEELRAENEELRGAVAEYKLREEEAFHANQAMAANWLNSLLDGSLLINPAAAKTTAAAAPEIKP